MLIVTDSAADLTPQDITEYGIYVVPLMIQFPPSEEVSAADISPDEFYNRLQAIVPQVPTTSQPSVGVFMKVYEEAAAKGQEVLSIHVSSGLSGTVNSARTAAAQVPNAKVTIIDAMTLSAGQRFQVLAAAKMVKQGKSVARIIERLSAIRAHTECAFTLETLEYLARGGRIGRVAAFAGALLSLKPVIHVDRNDGKYSTIGRGRTMTQTMNTLVTNAANEFSNQPVWVNIVHGQFQEKADALAELMRSKLNVAHLDVVRISPVLGVHTGPGIVGAGVVPMSHFTDLE